MKAGYFLMVSIGLLIVGCDERFEYELPVNEPRIVANFIAENDKSWVGTVAASKPILEFWDFTSVDGVQVSFYEDDKLIEVLKNVKYEFQRDSKTQTSPKPGHAYAIEVTAPGFATAGSSYVQPLAVPIERFEIERAGPDPSHQNVEMVRFIITFVDPPGPNFYELSISAAWDANDPIMPREYYLFFEDPAYPNQTSGYFLHENALFDDGYFDGKRVTLSFKSYAMTYTGPTPESYKMEYHRASLRNTTKSYFRYYNTVYAQAESRLDPYSQPVKIENNINNGFGIFGGYTTSVVARDFLY